MDGGCGQHYLYVGVHCYSSSSSSRGMLHAAIETTCDCYDASISLTFARVSMRTSNRRSKGVMYYIYSTGVCTIIVH
jgi:hypothetical protein